MRNFYNYLRLFLLFAFAGWSLGASAQQAQLKGLVVDASTNEPSGKVDVSLQTERLKYRIFGRDNGCV